MCNLYHSTPRDRLPAVFASIVQQIDGPGYAPVAAPLKLAPYIRARGAAVVGQWGMIPPSSKTRTPTTSSGKRMSTNNARIEGVAKAWTFRFAWGRGQRCLIPAESYDEPYWGTGKNIWWRFARADGMPWALAGLWSEWTDPETGEVVPNFTMLTQNCDGHPLLSLMHKPDGAVPPDKRSVVPIERADWDAWLHGNNDQAQALIRVPPVELFVHGAADPAKQVDLPL
ncbi:MAG: SOS response-associated peptidase [Ramlibacter sp.]